MCRIYLLATVAMACVIPGLAAAGGTLGGDEITALLSGKTVSGEVREGQGTGFGRNMLSGYADEFVFDFDAGGTVSGSEGDKSRHGRWYLEGDELCLQWDGKKKPKCGPVHREGDFYRHTIRSRGGRIKFQFTYRTFAGAGADGA